LPTFHINHKLIVVVDPLVTLVSHLSALLSRGSAHNRHESTHHHRMNGPLRVRVAVGVEHQIGGQPLAVLQHAKAGLEVIDLRVLDLDAFVGDDGAEPGVFAKRSVWKRLPETGAPK
jgi:hypothetical protein